MKKLIIYNHLNVKEVEYDVFVEGNDFAVSYAEPKCILIGSIVLADKEPSVSEPQDIVAMTVANNQELRELIEQEVVTDEKLQVEVTDMIMESEVQNESKAVCNQSDGDKGVNSPNEPQSAEKLHKDNTRRGTRKRG